MDQAAPSAFAGSRQILLKKSFKLFIRYMLTACSTEEFFKAFSTYDKSKQEALYQLFIQVINSLHHDIEEEFEPICHDTQVGAILDKVEQLVDEWNQDVLSNDKANLVEVKQAQSRDKKDEIRYLESTLTMVVEENRNKRAQVESLKNGKQDSLAFEDAVNNWSLKYRQISQQWDPSIMPC